MSKKYLHGSSFCITVPSESISTSPWTGVVSMYVEMAILIRPGKLFQSYHPCESYIENSKIIVSWQNHYVTMLVLCVCRSGNRQNFKRLHLLRSCRGQQMCTRVGHCQKEGPLTRRFAEVMPESILN